ncbi:uncharacterized protein LOC114328086 [Diabrotica virgifera virgifera]|uniref:Uncharacterized protein LOC114328086 n=1 Tax=Diabrotica virgifera virgifera TaxID=50390 RepID=A0A6P7FHR3_DIAVI|nr:uncharacterized protein LOC114328086 [Diabrotica virgifera virgifera]
MGDIEARREARRKKILQNSESRLQRITGVENKSKIEIEGISSSPDQFQPDAVATEAIPRTIHTTENHTFFNNVDEPTNFNIQTNNFNNDVQTIFYNTRINEDTSVAQIVPPPQTNSRHLYILLIPILWSLLIAVCDIINVDISVFYINKIFLPLIAFEIHDFYFSPDIPVSSTVLSSILLLSGRPYSRKLNIFIQYFMRLVQDVMIYFFVFLVSRLCMIILFFKF